MPMMTGRTVRHRFVPDGAGFVLVDHEIDRLILIDRYDRPRPTGLAHATEPELKLPSFDLF